MSAPKHVLQAVDEELARGRHGAGALNALRTPPTLAIVFDPADQRYAEELRKAFVLMRRSGRLADVTLNDRPDTADVVVPLISQSLLLWWEGPGGQKIMQRRANGDAVVYPVALHAVTDDGTSLSRLQTIPGRSFDGPQRTLDSYRDLDEGLVEVVREIRRALEQRR